MALASYQAMLFDMDGVVVDTGHTVAAFWQELAASQGFTISDQDLDDHVYGRHADHTLRTLFTDMPVERHPEVYDRLRTNDQQLRYTDIPGAGKLLGQLREGNIALALVTGAQHWKVDAVLDQLGLVDTFDVQIRAEDVSAGKPDPSCYRLAAERLGVDIHRCLVFEDAISGVMAAVAAGAACVALAPPRRAEQMLAIGADGVVSNFHDVTFSADDRILRLATGKQFPFLARTAL